MDNLCHSLVGAAMGEAGLKHRTPWGNATLVAAANLPDLDALVFLTGGPSVGFRRGWTHGVLAQALLPFAFTALVVGLDRWLARRRGRAPRMRPGAVLLLSFAGVLSHVFLDYLNNYGVRLLKPFSERWFYGDAVFIVDPWLWLVLAAGIALSYRGRSAAPARAALAVATIYIAGMLWLSALSRQIVLDAWTMTRGREPRAMMVGPTFLNPFRKAIIIDTGAEYETGTLLLWPRTVRFAPDALPKNDSDPAAVRAREHPHVRSVLVWARFPYYEIRRDVTPPAVTLQDARFGRNVGSVTVRLSP